MTDYFIAWTQSLARRDAALLSIFLLSLTFLIAALLLLINVRATLRRRIAWIMFGVAGAMYYGSLMWVAR